MKVKIMVGGGRESQRGVALAVSLMLLLLITVLGITAMRSSILELYMARNEAARISAFERAQSLVDGLFESIATNFEVSNVGDTRCYNKTGCTGGLGALSPAAELVDDATEAARSAISVRYRSCFAGVPAVIGGGTSIDVLDTVEFQVEASYDASSAKQGRAEVGQGVLVLIPSGDQSACQ